MQEIEITYAVRLAREPRQESIVKVDSISLSRIKKMMSDKNLSMKKAAYKSGIGVAVLDVLFYRKKEIRLSYLTQLLYFLENYSAFSMDGNNEEKSTFILREVSENETERRSEK